MPAPAKPLLNKVILVAEDEEDLRDIVIDELKRAGALPISAANGVEALNLLQQHPVDALVSDMQMPQLDGLELIKCMRQQTTLSPIVIIVTGCLEIDAQETKRLGVNEVFFKPFRMPSLIATLAEHLTGISPSTRKSLRYPANMHALLEAPDQPALKAKVLNIGQGGMFVELDNNFQAHGKTFEFRIVENEPELLGVVGQGVCRWVKALESTEKQGLGIEFKATDIDNEQRLLHLVDKCRN